LDPKQLGNVTDRAIEDPSGAEGATKSRNAGAVDPLLSPSIVGFWSSPRRRTATTAGGKGVTVGDTLTVAATEGVAVSEGVIERLKEAVGVTVIEREKEGVSVAVSVAEGLLVGEEEDDAVREAVRVADTVEEAVRVADTVEEAVREGGTVAVGEGLAQIYELVVNAPGAMARERY
jgi:hypothetical protein